MIVNTEDLAETRKVQNNLIYYKLTHPIEDLKYFGSF